MSRRSYFVAFDRIRMYVINGGGRFFLFAYVLVNVVWTVQAAPEAQCAVERTDEDKNEFPFLMVVMTILAITFLFGLCLGSRCGRAMQARADVMEPEMESEPGTSREAGVQHEDRSEDAEMARLRYLVRRHEHCYAQGVGELWKDEVERYRQIRNEARRKLERVRVETLDHANVCPMNDHPVLVASRFGTAWHRDAHCGHLRNAIQIRQMDACEHCAADRFLPPFRYDGGTHTRLVDDVNAWFELSEDTSQLEANMVLVHNAFRGDDGP
eukprot:symbB.v1.2.033382.t1/scaffold4123.1/size58836/2